MAAQPARFPSGLSACYFLPLSSRLIWFLDCFLPWAMGPCAVSLRGRQLPVLDKHEKHPE